MSRRRNTAQRGRTGRIKTKTYQREFSNGEAKWARIRDLMRSIADAPRLTSELGRLHFIGEITSAQFQAGLSFGSMLEVYDWKILGVRRSVAAVNLDRVAGTSDAESWSNERLRQFKTRFEEIDGGLRLECGPDVHRATVALCRGDFAPRALGTKGLHWLVPVFKIHPNLDGETQMDNRAMRKVSQDVLRDVRHGT